MRKIFKELITAEEAIDIFYTHADISKKATETIPLIDSLNRVLSNDIVSPINVPPFDRASMDGFAVISTDLIQAEEDRPIELNVVGNIKAGYVFDGWVEKGTCVEISTGAPLPSGADAVVMVEYSSREGDKVSITSKVTPSENVMFAGTDIRKGANILSAGTLITSRELAVLSAMGYVEVIVNKRVSVGIFSSGDEIIPGGQQLKPGKLYDINSNSIMANLVEIGAEPHFLGIINDKYNEIEDAMNSNIGKYDLLIISGGTSAGMGDMLYEILENIGNPGLLVHGIKVKPGKPTILAVCNGTPIIGLPGYPASALSIFKLFVVPYIRLRSGISKDISREVILAVNKQKLRSVMGRHEFKPVNVIKENGEYILYPVPGGSGAITSIALADGFIEIPANQTSVPVGTPTEVSLLSANVNFPDLQIIGAYDPVLMKAMKIFREKYKEYTCRFIATGASAGVAAIRRGEAHIATINLIDEKGNYNNWVIENFDATLISGFSRNVGMIVSKGNPKEIYTLDDLRNEKIKIINRKQGTSLRALLDLLLDKMRIDKNKINGYNNSVNSDTAAIQAVKTGIVDVAFSSDPKNEESIEFLVLREEEYDFLISDKYKNKPALQKFVEILESKELRDFIIEFGYKLKN